VTERTPHGLEVRLDAPLPAAVAAGEGTVVFVAGTCFAPDAQVASLELEVDGRPQPLLAHGMPRLDLPRALGAPTSYRSGFWGLARLQEGGPWAVGLRARLEGGEVRRAEIGTIAAGRLPAPLRWPAPHEEAGPRVAVAMATYEPPPDLLRAQMDSLRAQTHRNWICVISDDASGPAGFARLEAAVGDDPRFVLSRSPERLGFYRNFERALALVPAEADFVALADQDDAWHADKLERLLAAIGPARLAYSDARVVTEAGELVADTWWSVRRPQHEDLLSLLVANAVTGAASLLRRDLLALALPFPPGQFAHFHDHWLALCARATGEVRYVDAPLYDYVQHGTATLGHAAANRMPRLRERAGALRRDPRERVRMWRMHYFVDVCRLLTLASVLELRAGDAMPPPQRRALQRFTRAEDHALPVARLALRGARELLGRGRPETLGAEWMLAHAFAWRRLLAATARDRPQRVLRLDAVPPPALDPHPGATAPTDPGLRAMAEKVAPLRLAVRDDAPRRVNLLIPTIDLAHFFGGYIAKLNLARRLSEAGARVRIITVDPVGPLPREWQRELEGYAGLAGVFDRVEVAFGRESPGLEVSRDDAWVASTWWTAHIAGAALAELDREGFLYLIQEHEPFTFPMGSYAALAAGSYRLPHTALFSSDLLQGYFRRHGLGVYAAGEAAGDASSIAFENAITPVEPPEAAALAGRRPRQLLFYARPEAHAERNLFELGALALARAIERGAFAGADWRLHGIGTVNAARRLDLGGGASLELLPRTTQAEYGQVLREHDVGLALMYTPHPSLVPIEMASAGMVTVTSSFENKTAEAMRAISPNLLAAEPSVEEIADALCSAAVAADDAEARVRGAAVRWARDWDTAFDDAVVTRALRWLA
jgi:GT2 family glycosyltransferase